MIRVSSYFKNEQTNIENQSKKLNEIYRKIQPQGLSKNEEINAEPIETAREMIERNFDKEYGGIGLGITEAALMMMNVAKIGGMSAASSIHMNIFAGF